jgi:NADH-ubiquinone oxidoreductase chain 4
MLLAIIVIYYNVGSTDFRIISLSNINPESQKILWLAFFLSFAIKTPLRPFHMWLPRAHAEAPLAGSILLAGLFLKLATYGFLRILINFMPDATNYFSPLVQTIAIVTLIYSSLATIRQIDFKRLVAYSSISHIAIVVLGLFSNTIIGIEGAIALSVAHGFISPAIFTLVGGVLYDRGHTRIIRYYRGLVLYMPVFALLFFLTTIANIGIPLSLNWAGEYIALSGTFQRSPVVRRLGSTGIVLSACYSIFLFNRITFGSHSQYLKNFKDVSRREYVLLITMLIPAFILGIFPNILLNDIHVSVTELLYYSR